MILSMSEQAKEFMLLVLSGMTAALAYDVIRVLRRVIRHSILAVNIEDLVFWLIFSIGVMLVILWNNNGVLRVYCAAAPIIGMILYFAALSRLFLTPATAFARFIKKIFIVILHIFCIPLVFIGKLLRFLLNIAKKLLYKFNKIVKNLLKKFLKCERIINGLLVKLKYGSGKAYRCNRVEEGKEKREKK